MKNMPDSPPLPNPLPPEPAIPLSVFAALRDRKDSPTLTLTDQQDLVNDFRVVLQEAVTQGNQADLNDALMWIQMFGQRLDIDPQIYQQVQETVSRFGKYQK